MTGRERPILLKKSASVSTAEKYVPEIESASGSTAAQRTKLESTVRYLGIEVDDALEMAEQTEV
ncbi:hypothetical protein AO073_24435 [Pseudomonas syringae ICMP 11293]|uniref:hypothetical protein n=1 Tax=Pseudomonas syringae TaxID=317 RepID=UPI00072FF3D0|nr:hypothetical protein AO073_24435 [Pseudomonas syringae ICMP 11293]